MPEPGPFLALDVGDRTIGVAVSNPLGWAAPVITLQRRSLDRDLDRLRALVEEHRPTRLVVGLPLNMDDTEGPRAARTRRFAEAIGERLGLPVVLWDERLSTFEADQRLQEAGVRPRERKAVIDMVAAQVILEDYLAAGAPETGR